MMAVALPASFCINMVLGTTPEAYLEVKSAMLSNLFFEGVGDWHLFFTLVLLLLYEFSL
jgi:hypothetical protein